jgi:hypothetical protein
MPVHARELGAPVTSRIASMFVFVFSCVTTSTDAGKSTLPAT